MHHLGVGRILLTALAACVVVAVVVALAILASGGSGVAVAGGGQTVTSSSDQAEVDGSTSVVASTQGEDGAVLAEGELPDPYVDEEWLDWPAPDTPPPATPRAKIRGRGKILKYPLLFRYTEGYNGNEYFVIARSADRFAVYPEGGWKSDPGWMWVGDSPPANLEDFEGFGHGTPRGRCFYWGGVEKTKALDKLRVGDKVSITFLLRRTEGVQRRVVRLKQTGSRIRSLAAKATQRSIRAIGCKHGFRHF